MQNFIKLQNVLLDPKKTFDDFKSELLHSQITQFTYICLLLNITATIKRPNFNFELYLDLLTSFKNEPGYRSSCVNYTGYKDKISILMNACEKSVSSTVVILATHPHIKLHAVDPNGHNAVFYAIKNAQENEGLKILQILYDLSPQIVVFELSQIHTVTNNGFSPLFLAVEGFRCRIVDFLLKNHTDPNQRLINSGNTAMHEMIRIGIKNAMEQIRKMVEIFLRYDFDLTLKNNQQKTVQQYAIDYRLNLTQLIKQIKFLKRPQSQFGCQLSQTQAYSSHITMTKVQDIFTTYNYSQLQENQFYHQTDGLSVSNKSLLSQEINHIHYNNHNQRQFSVDMNLHQSEYDYCDDIQQIDTRNCEIGDKKMQCHSHSDTPNSDFQMSDHQANQRQELNENQDNLQQQSCSDQSQQQGSSVRTQQINFTKISKQILQFDQISQGIYISAWQQMQSFFTKLKQVTDSLNLNIQVIGSFATGLWTHHSDIDIALVAVNQSYVDFQRLLEKVFNKIKVRMYNMGIKQLSYNKASKIPSIKIEMDLHLFASRKIDIMIFHKKNMGITYVNYMREALSSYGLIRPIFFFLKRVCQQFGLHDPFNGGMKSYSIFLMIYSMIRSFQFSTLAQFLLKISLYFGFYHQYQYQIQHRNNSNTFGVEYVPVPRLNISDPLNTKNNMGGKNTDVYRLKNMFRTIYYGMHKKINQGTTLQHILEMANVIL